MKIILIPPLAKNYAFLLKLCIAVSQHGEPRSRVAQHDIVGHDKQLVGPSLPRTRGKGRHAWLLSYYMGETRFVTTDPSSDVRPSNEVLQRLSPTGFPNVIEHV